MSHKFRLNQTVRRTKTAFADGLAGTSAVYEVVRLMPLDASGEPSYRVKASGTAERAVRESEIEAVEPR